MADEDRLLVYEKPTCTTCRRLAKLLRERGIEFDRVDYTLEPISRERLVELLEMMGAGPRELLRTRHEAYGRLGLRDESVSDDAILDAMAENPELVQRPIVVRGDRAVLARPPERVDELFE